MITTTLDSTFLQEATYDSSRRMLTVVFKNGRTYSYQNVDKTVYDGLINARSSSRFFGANIRGQFTTGSRWGKSLAPGFVGGFCILSSVG